MALNGWVGTSKLIKLSPRPKEVRVVIDGAETIEEEEEEEDTLLVVDATKL
jgi:hypothetical protein